MLIQWHPAIPPDVRAMAEPLLQKWKHIIPSWCERVFVSWEQADNCKLQIFVREDQRDAILEIHPDWVSFPEERERAIVHELCHFYNAPLKDWAKSCIERIIGNDYPTPGSEVAEHGLDEACERTNGDLIALVMRLAKT
jgi:hypothetical protein